MKRFLAVIEFVTSDDDNDAYCLKACIDSALNNENYIFSESKFERRRFGIKQIDTKEGGK